MWWIHAPLKSSPCINFYEDHFSYHMEPYVTQVRFDLLEQIMFQTLMELY
jgi:hypothetical protein